MPEKNMMRELPLKERLEKRKAALTSERVSFEDHWRSLSEFVKPRRSRFYSQDRNKGDRLYNNIINSRATQAHRTAQAGMFSGIMSPSRPWLVLEDPDKELMEFAPVKQWYFQVQEQMRRVMHESNLYETAPNIIGDMLLFATGCMTHEDHPENLAHFRSFPIGSYWVSQDDFGRANTVIRDVEMTVEQIVTKFSKGREINQNISLAVRNSYDRGDYDTWYPVVHHMDSNPEFLVGSRRPSQRRFRSVYYEPGQPALFDKVLSSKGFDEFPCYVPRWDVTGEDIYGTDCPGMVALGDVRQLQHEEKEKAKGLSKMVSPPLQAPVALRNVKINQVPSGVTVYNGNGDQAGISSLYNVDLPIGELRQDIQDVENRINEAFHVDLFLAISAMEGIQPRNQLELTQRNQERLIQLGPVLQRTNRHMLDPMVDRMFMQLHRQKLLPPAPPEIQGRPIRVRYVSMLALAQQSMETGNIDRLIQFAGGLAALGWPGALEKLDAEQAVDEFAGLIGTNPMLIVPDEVVEERRQAQQQAQERKMQLDQAQQAATALRTAGDTKMGPDSLAGQVTEQAREGGQ
jgi:hypothetical protein